MKIQFSAFFLSLVISSPLFAVGATNTAPAPYGGTPAPVANSGVGGNNAVGGPAVGGNNSVGAPAVGGNNSVGGTNVGGNNSVGQSNAGNPPGSVNPTNPNPVGTNSSVGSGVGGNNAVGTGAPANTNPSTNSSGASGNTNLNGNVDTQTSGSMMAPNSGNAQ